VKGQVVTHRLRIIALVALAMINVATLGAGVAVAGLLPARLALWQIPRVAAAPVAAAPPVLPSGGPAGALPSRARLAAVLGPLAGAHALGGHVGAVVTDLASGATLYARQATSAFAPASSEKLVTAVAALSVLGPGARIATRVVRGAAPHTIVLAGGGDPTLAVNHPPSGDYPQPATLASLAGATIRWLRGHGQHAVKLVYDTSLFTGPPMAPGWTPSYITTGNVTPITSLEVDQGRLTAAGKPQDADNPGNFRPRSATPAADAAAAFASLLRAGGIRVTGKPAAGRAPRGAATIATVWSPMISAVVGWMLRESNNVIAEDLARHVALAAGAPASFRGAATAVTRVLATLGVRRGIRLVDGSGLSPRDRITPAALAAVVRLPVLAGRPGLRPVVAGLPVAGFSGTLAPGQSVFTGFRAAALGRVRAKTGNLNRVVSLAGIVDDAGGRWLAFAFMADKLPAGQLGNAGRALGTMASALAACGCR
jgi:serine-type D-Ala-D-Ala carboxypeptidase/endopeptidase (penicillin-binding protein 4)